MRVESPNHRSSLMDHPEPRSRSLAMLARLWWKEFRMFRPLWPILVLAAGLIQWLLLSTGSPDARSGALTVASVSWAVLYAFAAGAAAFAGERESKTLGFLDALPVPRGTLWLGKVSFAFVSTFGLCWPWGSWPPWGRKRAIRSNDIAIPTLFGSSGRSCSRRWPGACSGRRCRKIR